MVVLYNLPFSQINKFNASHDDKGRFASGGGISAKGANTFKRGFSMHNLNEHFGSGGQHDHTAQYRKAGIKTKELFEKEALGLIQSACDNDILGYKNAKGQIVRYRISTNDFVKGHPRKGIATMFKPKSGIKYYTRKLAEEGIEND
jgi:hypothetical protein